MSYVYPRQFFGWGNDGKLAATQEGTNRFEFDQARAASVRNANWLSSRIDAFGQPDVRALPIEFLAEVVSTTSIGANRWSYTVKKVELVDPAFLLAANTRDSVDVSQNEPSVVTFTAWNLYELKHGGTHFGDGTLVANLPAGAELTPIVGVVLCHAVLDNATNAGSILRYVFDRANGVECPPP
jgi:hypothetical protein